MALSRTLILSSLYIGIATAQQSVSPSPAPFQADTPGGSHASADLRISGPDPDGWLFPITRLNQSLPQWVQFGGEFRNRTESADGITFAAVDDAYDLTRLRLGIYIQPVKWVELVAVTQDSRVFFNHHVANASPYQNIWDFREAYLRLGNSTEGWLDLVAGRQMFSSPCLKPFPNEYVSA
jgi:hypothetical protein